jgi:predicted ATPase
MKIEYLKIKNFKVFKEMVIKDIPKFCVFLGKNGSGKSTLFQIFGFLRECLNTNVHTALLKQGGSKGFSEVRSRDSIGDIEIMLKFRAQKYKNNPLITYFLKITEKNGKAIVEREILKYRRGQKGKPWEFLNFSGGSGEAVINEGLGTTNESELKREKQSLKSPDILAIKGLAQFEKFPAAVSLGDLIDSWHLSDIHISQARKEQEVGHAEHLSTNGENLSLVIDYFYKNHKQNFENIIEVFKKSIPGIIDAKAQTIETGQVLLKVKDKSFNEPFLVRYISDGTIKMLAYLVLLNDPKPHTLLCVEEPENQLYYDLLERLAEQFRGYTREGGQVLISTHSPDFLNAVAIDEVFFLIKKKGYTTIQRASDNEQLKKYIESGDKMGYLWKQGDFEDMDL